MKQVLQDLRSGTTSVTEVPCPLLRPRWLLVRNDASVISTGTERMLVRFGRATLLEKARQHPDRVRQVWEKLRNDGALSTLEAVRNKLETPLPLGYSSSGVVVAIGEGAEGFRVGDRVASNGPHAEWVCVPERLCAGVPDEVPADQAAFAAVASIPLHGVRLLQPALGETCVVMGLGLLGLIAVQLLHAAGLRVLGFDVDPERCRLARDLAVRAEVVGDGLDPVASGLAFSDGIGVDGVLITASTPSSDPVNHAAAMCRKRGRIVQVGLTGLALLRDPFYKKELSLQVSCSSGPGRYDPEYEDEGHDYPLGYVRWTEQRNIGAVLEMLARGQLRVGPLISHRMPFERAADAYDLIHAGHGLAIVLEYPTGNVALPSRSARTIELAPPLSSAAGKPCPGVPDVVLGVVGAGNYAVRTMLPLLPTEGCRRQAIASRSGISGTYAARKFGFSISTTDPMVVCADPAINGLLVLTRHDSHARYAIEGLHHGQAVFVEKPLCLWPAELDAITATYGVARAPNLMVGFNRRFAPLVGVLKRLLTGVTEPRCFVVTVNAGALPADHWTHHPTIGGGRLLGEGIHFVDLLRFLAGSPIVDAYAQCVGAHPVLTTQTDKATVTLRFADGSWGAIHYLANGARSYPKERLEVFTAGRVLLLENYRVLRGFGWPGFRRRLAWRRDKGHRACLLAWLAAVRAGRPAPIPFNEIVEVHRVGFALRDAVATSGNA